MSANSRTKVILHIDDDPDDHLLVRSSIESIDATIILHTAKDGKKGIEFLEQAKLLSDLPCLIILDLNMPLMNGYETYKIIKQDPMLYNIPLVIFTTSFGKKDAVYWEKENVVMITKPASIEKFTDCVKRILDYCSL